MADLNTQKDDSDCLWVTDAELIRRSGVPRDKMRQALHMYDKDPHRTGFPPKVKLYGDRRYWPAVKAYFERQGGLTLLASANQRGQDV